MSADAVQIRLPDTNADQKLKQAALDVLRDLEVICKFMNDIVEKQLGQLASIFDIISSRKSYRLRNLIDPRYSTDTIDHASDELVVIAKNNLLQVYKIFMQKEYVANPSQSHLDIIQDIYQTQINLDNAGTDCYQITPLPKIVELVNVTDFFALCMQNAHMPLTYVCAAKRSPLEKQYGELFSLFKIQDNSTKDESPSRPVDPDVRYNRDAYVCYYLKWMLMYLNGIVINHYQIFSKLLPIIEKNFSEICLLIKVHLNIQFDHRIGSIIDDSFMTLSAENHHIEPKNNQMVIENIFTAIKQSEKNTYHLSMTLHEIIVALIATSTYSSVAVSRDSSMIADQIKTQFENVKLAIRLLHVRRAEMFRKLPGLKSYSEILASTVPFFNQSDVQLEDVLSNFSPMMEDTLKQLGSLNVFGEWENSSVHKTDSVFHNNFSSAIMGLCGGSLKSIKEVHEFCIKHITPHINSLNEQQAAKAAEHDKKEEEQYKASTQSPKVRSRSGSLGGDYGKTVSKSSPRAAASPSTSDPIMIVRASSRESKDNSDKGYTFMSAISSALRVITTNQKKDSTSAGSPRIQSPTQQLSPRVEQTAEGIASSAAAPPQRP